MLPLQYMKDGDNLILYKEFNVNKFKLLLSLIITFSLMFGSNSAYAQTNHKKHHKGLSTHHKKSHKKHKPKNYMIGTASFYGENDGFDGQDMADGHAFNTNNVYNCAHPTLPLGTKLKVTNLANGRTIYVEVTDRMPKTTGRVIDLSMVAAKYLGMHQRGITRVKLVRISDEEFEERKGYLEVDPGDDGHRY